jgi:hypothetical protein
MCWHHEQRQTTAESAADDVGEFHWYLPEPVDDDAAEATGEDPAECLLGAPAQWAEDDSNDATEDAVQPALHAYAAEDALRMPPRPSLL